MTIRSAQPNDIPAFAWSLRTDSFRSPPSPSRYFQRKEVANIVKKS